MQARPGQKAGFGPRYAELCSDVRTLMDEMLARLLFKNGESGYTYLAECAR